MLSSIYPIPPWHSYASYTRQGALLHIQYLAIVVPILAKDFSLYIHRPTATDKSFAPKGCDSFYVLSPVPNLKSKICWEEEGDRYKKKILSFSEVLFSSRKPLNNAINHCFHMFRITKNMISTLDD